jgi:hypothetical protein
VWFCDLRGMPRLRDCAAELASRIPTWFHGLFRSRPGWRAAGRGDAGPQPVLGWAVRIVSTDVAGPGWDGRLGLR